MGIRVKHLPSKEEIIKQQRLFAMTLNAISDTPLQLSEIAEEHFILSDAVKQVIEITYNSLGQPSISTANLGMQYDNRVTWLQVHLDDLLWNVYGEPYTDSTKYDRYIFKFHFSKDGIETESWRFDPRDYLEIPRDVTQNAGTYDVTLTIQEDVENNNSWFGNVPDEASRLKHAEDPTNPLYINEEEDFVAAPWQGIVEESIIYKPTLDIQVLRRITDQKRALTKPRIDGRLSDFGILELSSLELGRQYDRFITYIRFDPDKISNHLNNFTVILAFKKDNRIYYSWCEPVNTEDKFDDTEDNKRYPLVAWIPPEVMAVRGEWQMCVIAYAGTFTDPTLPDINGYYFYVSRSMTVTVLHSFITRNDLDKDYKEVDAAALYSSAFIADGDGAFYTSLHKLYKVRQ